jgi:hypothetical protein
MDRYTKAQKKRLRQLRDTAYERELDHELEKIYQNFKKWRSKEIDGFEKYNWMSAYYMDLDACAPGRDGGVRSRDGVVFQIQG